MEIYSRISPDLKLHMIHRWNEFPEDGRVDLCEDREGLQVATITIPEGHRFRPHIHVNRGRMVTLTQECWIIVRGDVEVTYYDIDGSLLQKETLGEGDCTITLRGGHTYEAVEGALVYEIKTGPYDPAATDKEFIDD